MPPLCSAGTTPNSPTLHEATAEFGRSAKARLGNPAASGEPEDQLRGPFEQLMRALAELCGHRAGDTVLVGESAVTSLRIRPDYAVTVRGALVGFVELKAPGKGADPRRMRGAHDKAQWQRLQCLPNLMYSDGNEFTLWRDGELKGRARMEGDIETAGHHLAPGEGLLALFSIFLRWENIAPRTAKELADTSARLCRLLRDEVVEALAQKVDALTTLATDWRGLLFPEASDAQFADGYAQAVTFGLLMARARGISIGSDLHRVADRRGAAIADRTCASVQRVGRCSTSPSGRPRAWPKAACGRGRRANA